MLAEIREIIESKLPEHVGKVLKERLYQADRDSESLASMDKLCKSIQEERDKLRSDLRRHEAIEAREKQISEREAAVLKRELLAELNEFKVKSAEAAKADIFRLAECVFHNPRLVYSTSENRNVPVSSMGHVAQVYDSSSTTVEEH